MATERVNAVPLADLRARPLGAEVEPDEIDCSIPSLSAPISKTVPLGDMRRKALAIAGASGSDEPEKMMSAERVQEV